MKVEAMAVLNEFFKINKKKGEVKLTLPLVMKYIHFSDILYFSIYKERMIDDLTLYGKIGPFYEIIMRKLSGLGYNKEITFEIVLDRYDINGQKIGFYLPKVTEINQLKIINETYDTFKHIEYEKLIDLACSEDSPVGIATKKGSYYVNNDCFKESLVE